MYSKGVRYYEDEPVADATIADLDMNFVAKYCKRINYSKTFPILCTIYNKVETKYSSVLNCKTVLR